MSELGADRIELRYRADPSWLWNVRHETARQRPDLLLTHGFNGHLVALVTSLGALARTQRLFIPWAIPSLGPGTPIARTGLQPRHRIFPSAAHPRSPVRDGLQ